ARRVFGELKHNQACCYVEQLMQERLRAEISRINTLTMGAATAVQRQVRGWRVRLLIARAEVALREEILCAIRLQRAWRSRKSMLEAMRTLLREARRLRNPFLQLHTVGEVVHAAVESASKHFNPRNTPAGAHMYRVCHSLGCHLDVWPLMSAAGLTSAEDIRGMTDESLQALGITEEVQGDVRNGILYAQEL
ncbi:unnamed protein product, partial [Chrysoparadoxa australica]